jgi:hypothetical protein
LSEWKSYRLSLRQQVRRIGAWKSKKLAILDERRARATADGQTMRKDEERRLEDRRKRVEDTFNRFHQVVQRSVEDDRGTVPSCRCSPDRKGALISWPSI